MEFPHRSLFLPPCVLLLSMLFFISQTVLTTALVNSKSLTENTLKLISQLAGDGDFNIKTGKLLAPILIPRTPGSDGSRKVLGHFQNFFSTELPSWTVSTHNASWVTPRTKAENKTVLFTNFIATKDPPWKEPGEVGRLVLVAHYDSKDTPHEFIGATDSAVPCAVIMHVVRALDAALTRKWRKMEDEKNDEKNKADREAEQGIMVLFLDGEEAYERWSESDSLYGSRALANDWEALLHPPMSTRHSHLANIDLFVLLDLLGSAAPSIPSYFTLTHWTYRSLAVLESKLRKLGMFKSHTEYPGSWFPDKDKSHQSGLYSGSYGGIEDDHVPFQRRGVDILHIIPYPFPTVWHKMEDDGEHLHSDTVVDWATLMTAWTAEFLGLEGHFEAAQMEARPASSNSGDTTKDS